MHRQRRLARNKDILDLSIAAKRSTKASTPFQRQLAAAQIDGFASMPIRPLSFRDAGLYGRHIAQAKKGFTKIMRAEGHLLQAILGVTLGKPLRLPDGLPNNRPPYYHGNALTFIGADQTLRWPSTCAWLDYEVSPRASNPRLLCRF